MRKIYRLVIPMTLVVLLGLTACAPGWGQPGQGGMMGSGGGMGSGMMGSGMMGPGGMMGGQGGRTGDYSEVLTSLSHDEAKAIADRYLTSLNNPDLSIIEFEEYSHNFYISITETSTGRGALEVIIDRYSGSLQPELQSMMWNSKYGMMGGSQQTQMSVTQPQAMKIAQNFLDIVYPGTEAGEMVSYYGYYTIMTTLEGEHYGMLSVNGYSGQVWYHIWHGMFISEVAEFHEEN